MLASPGLYWMTATLGALHGRHEAFSSVLCVGHFSAPIGAPLPWRNVLLDFAPQQERPVLFQCFSLITDLY